jgi:hypothetical protein
VAVFDPALPGRSISCNGSPVPFWRDRRTRTRGVEPIPAFERRRGVFLLRVRRHQRRVEIDDQRRRRIAVVVRGVLTGQRPHPRSGLSARSLYSHQRVLGIGGQGVNQPRHGRVRSDTAEHPRLGAQQVHIGHAVPAERQRDRHIEQDLRWIMGRQRLRHGATADESRRSRPLLRTVSTSSTPPAWPTAADPLVPTLTRGYSPVMCFTWRVLLDLVR